MSLDREQRRATSPELIANMQICGMQPEHVEADLQWDSARLEETISLGPESTVEDVRLSEYLDRRIREGGGTPHP